MKEMLLKVTSNNLGRVRSLAFETCSTQLSIIKILSIDPDLQHIITVLCDAYGLNLFVSDIFRITWFKEIDN
jgi:hypothetical protein